MSRYRKTEQRMWADEKFRNLSPVLPSGQSLWIYLLIGKHTSVIPGLASIGKEALRELLKWDKEAFDKAFTEVFTEGLVEADWEAPLLWLPNALKHNKPESPNVVIGWGREFDLMPNCDLKMKAYLSMETLIKSMSNQYIDNFYSHCEKPRKALPKASVKPLVNQEQEQEQYLLKDKKLKQKEIVQASLDDNFMKIFELACFIPKQKKEPKVYPAERFVDFVDAYPKFRQKDQIKALKIWKRENLDKEADQIIEDVKKRIEIEWELDKPKFIPMLSTYLNRKSWNYDAITPRTENNKQRELSLEEYSAAIRTHSTYTTYEYPNPVVDTPSVREVQEIDSDETGTGGDNSGEAS